MRNTLSHVAAGLALAGALAFAACKESTSSNACGTGTPPSVAGTYKLASYTLGGTTIDTTQGATGQLRFHTALYGFNATLPGPTVIVDSGSYTISGIKCMSEVSVLNTGVTISGTFTLSGATAGSIFTFQGTSAATGPVAFIAVRQ